jgi:hypothetical protein
MDSTVRKDMRPLIVVSLDCFVSTKIATKLEGQEAEAHTRKPSSVDTKMAF